MSFDREKIYEEYEEMKKAKKEKKAKMLTIMKVSAVALFVLIVICNTITVIPTGYTGVRSTFGQISPAVCPTGLNFKIPFVQHIERVNNKQQDIVFEDLMQAETSERNEVFFDGVTVSYNINPEYSAWIYANISSYANGLVTANLVESALKTSAKTLTPVEVTGRATLEPLVKETLQKSVNEKYGADVVHIAKVVIANATFDDEYNNKIAQKQQAQMVYETQQIENKTNVEKAQADATVKTTAAKADADASIIKAEAEAEVKRIESEAAAKANETVQKSLTEEVLREKTINKWNGQLPRVELSGNSDAIINLEGVNE